MSVSEGRPALTPEDDPPTTYQLRERMEDLATDLVAIDAENASLRAELAREREATEAALTVLYQDDRCCVAVAKVCDEILDRSGALLGRIRARESLVGLPE